MRLKYFHDTIGEMKGLSYTPYAIAKHAPYQLSSLGHGTFGEKFYTEREYDKNYHILLTISGSGMVKYRGKTIPLEKNQAVLMNSNEYHYYCTGKSGIWEYKWVIIKGSGCSPFADLINQDTVNTVTFFDLSEFNYCYDRIIKFIESKDYQSDLKIPVLIMRMLTDLALNRNNTEYSNKTIYHKEIIEKSINFIGNNFHRHDLKIEDIAKITGFDKRYFSRLFNRFTGSNPYEYIIRLRIDKAKQLLKNTGITVSEVSFEVGFENVNAFIRDFKKFTGTTPLKFRVYDANQY